MIKSQILEYVNNTPQNTNISILNQQLIQYSNNITNFYKIQNLTKLEDFLYEITYNEIDYGAGISYADKFLINSGCSSVIANGFYGRNYDWYYDNCVSFIVHTNSNNNRHESYGVAQLTHLDKDIVELMEWNDMFAILPNLMLDGMNDAGVFCNINVAPSGDYGLTTGTNPYKENLKCFIISSLYS